LHYIGSERKRILEAHPGLKNTEQIRLLAQMWNALTPEGKEPYNKLAADDAKRYCIEYEEETKRNGGKRMPTASGAKRMMTNKTLPVGKKEVDPNKKKQPLTAFFRYIQFRR
jgi:hypothetical protein